MLLYLQVSFRYNFRESKFAIRDIKNFAIYKNFWTYPIYNWPSLKDSLFVT